VPRFNRYYTYMLTNKGNNVLYTGMTNDLERRMREHREGLNEGFTNRYNCHKLVWFDIHSKPMDAIRREKQIKGWIRAKKDDLINEMNPGWDDLSEGWR
jgi:putative endonuclease